MRHSDGITIAAMWDSYAKNVIPATASPIQVSETRRAFYAGAYSSLSAAHRLADTMPEGLAADHVDALIEELQQFSADVLKGKA